MSKQIESKNTIILVIMMFIFIVGFCFIQITASINADKYCKSRGLGYYVDIFPIKSPRCEQIVNGEKKTYLLNDTERKNAWSKK